MVYIVLHNLEDTSATEGGQWGNIFFHTTSLSSGKICLQTKLSLMCMSCTTPYHTHPLLQENCIHTHKSIYFWFVRINVINSGTLTWWGDHLVLHCVNKAKQQWNHSARVFWSENTFEGVIFQMEWFVILRKAWVWWTELLDQPNTTQGSVTHFSTGHNVSSTLSSCHLRFPLGCFHSGNIIWGETLPSSSH